MNNFFQLKNLFFFFYLLKSVLSSPPITDLFSFTIHDNRIDTLSPQGKVEYHCFNSDSNGMKNYVRGTYGYYGYFEGLVDSFNPLTFHINWYETGIGNGDLIGLTGSGILNYSSTWNAVSGTYWISGPGDMNDSFKRWNSINGTFLTDDSSSAGSDILLSNCLYPGINYESPRSSITVLSDLSITSSSDSGSTTFCKVPVGGSGTWLGTYLYKYTKAVDGINGIETGNYGVNSIGFSIKSGRGFVGKWIANTGPFAGGTGSNIYITISRSSSILIIGFYCFVNSNLIRTNCSTEYYEVLTDKSTSEYQQLIASCPNYYRTDNSLESLYNFASLGYQHHSSCKNGNKDTPVSWTIAIIFIIFSGFLIFTFIYIIIVVKNHKNSLISPSNV